MKVLILTVTAGQGHNQTAMAVADYLESLNVNCEVLDVYKYISPILSDSVEKGYLIGTHYTPGVYGRIYRIAEKSESQKKLFSMGKFSNSIFGQKLLRYINETGPDVIITTHMFTAVHLTYLAPHIPNIMTIGIVTDFKMHPYWESTDLDYYVTASRLMDYQCAKKGISHNKILPFGIPVQKKFSKSIPKEEAKKILGIDNEYTILIMMGSMGYGNVTKIVRQIDNIGADFQMLCVCGHNTKAKKSLEKMNIRHKVYSYGYVDNVDIMMDAAEFIITKPGGVTMSESLAKGLPVILVNPIPGQEDRNQEFLVNNGLAMAVSDTYPVDEAVYQLLCNEWRREHFSEGIKWISNPNSAKDLGDFIVERLGK